MPRLSRRQKAIKSARKFFKRLLVVNIVVEDDIVDEADGADENASLDSSNSTLDDLLIMAYARLNVLQTSRYSERQLY